MQWFDIQAVVVGGRFCVMGYYDPNDFDGVELISYECNEASKGGRPIVVGAVTEEGKKVYRLDAFKKAQKECSNLAVQAFLAKLQ